MKRITLFFLYLSLISGARAEDGSQLWLRYQPANKAIVKGVDCLAADELRTYYAGEEVTLLIDTDIPRRHTESVRKIVGYASVLVASVDCSMGHMRC